MLKKAKKMHFMNSSPSNVVKHESGTNAIEFHQFSLLKIKFMNGGGGPNFERNFKQRSSSIWIKKESEIHELQPQPG